jgi:glycosyltransferase involved in cell wall biosynthesis
VTDQPAATMLDRPLLSIVIPSYNRGKLLLALLGKFDRPNFFPFDYEIIVTNNNSSDPLYRDVEALRPDNYRFRYYRHSENIGAVRNFFAGYRKASGRFCFHLCDDDDILPDEVMKIVETMQSQDDIVASFALFRSSGGALSHVQTQHRFPDAVYDLSSAEACADMLASSEFPFPENGIFRTDILAHAVHHSDIINYIFPLLANLLKFGKVAFRSEAYYTLLEGSGDEARQSGQLNFEDWEKLSRGFRLFTAWATKRRSIYQEGPVAKRILAQFLQKFCIEHQSKRKYAEFYSLIEYINVATDMELFGPAAQADMKFLSHLDKVARVANDTPGCRAVFLVSFHENLKELFGLTTLKPDIEVVTAPMMSVAKRDMEDAVYLVPTDAMRTWLASRLDVPFGCVYSMESFEFLADYSWAAQSGA